MSNKDFKLQTPILFLVFNRLDTTKQVFEAIRKAQPPRLYIAADGAREHREGEAEKVKAVRDYIINNIDWDCEVKTLFREKNLGCKVNPYTGINWFFENEEQGIILEDDCLPDQSFFRFCQELLNYYKDDKRIMLITGSNPLIDWKSDFQSYHFSYYGGIWGWATWRRAWKYYDVEMSLWKDEEIKMRIRDVLADDRQYKTRYKVFDKTYQNNLVTWWDYQWSFARLVQSGLSIVSSLNLITNIGFGEDATHTISKQHIMSNLPAKKISFPLTINSFVAVDRDYDNTLFKTTIKQPNIVKRILNRIKYKLPK